MINLKREKLRSLLQQEMEEYQYEIYSNNGSQYLLDKFISFKNYNNKNKESDGDNNLNYNYYNKNNKLQLLNQNNIYNNIDSLNNNNPSNAQIEQDLFTNNNISSNNKYNEFNQQNNDNYLNNYYQNNQMNNNINFNYGNIDLDAEINNYNSHYNKLKVDEFISKKMIQDDLLNKINQKLAKINKNINDKVYQENLAANWQQNNENP